MPSFRLSSRVNWFESGSEVTSGSLMPEAPDEDNSAPLHISASNSHVGIVELLFRKGPSTKIIDEDNTTPLHLAAGGGYNGLVEFLLGNTPSKLEGHTSVLELLFGNGTSIEATDNDKNTPLHLAACIGHTSMVDLLLRKGASTEARNIFYQTPLELAAGDGHTDVVQLLKSKVAELARGSCA